MPTLIRNSVNGAHITTRRERVGWNSEAYSADLSASRRNTLRYCALRATSSFCCVSFNALKRNQAIALCRGTAGADMIAVRKRA